MFRLEKGMEIDAGGGWEGGRGEGEREAIEEEGERERDRGA